VKHLKRAIRLITYALERKHFFKTLKMFLKRGGIKKRLKRDKNVNHLSL